MIRKILAIFVINWSENIYMRGESIVWFLLELIPTVYIILLWQSMYRNGSVAESQYIFMMIYQILTLIIARLSGSHFEGWVIDEIKEGKLSKPLLRPIPYPIFLFVLEAVWRIFGFIYMIPVILAIAFTWGDIFLHNIIWNQWGWFILFIVVSYIQRYLVSMLIACAGFWFEQAPALMHIKWMIEGTVGGAWLPLSLFPVWVHTLSSWTPFYYWYHVPAMIVINPGLENKVQLLMGSVFWVVVMGLLTLFTWKKAIRHYSAVGA